MGHKVHPTGIRLGIAKDWNSKWYDGKKEYAEYLKADLKVREMLRKRLSAAGISKILIERPAKTARVTIHTARPGVVIGKRGEDIEKLRKDVSAMMGVPAHINVTEVRKPELDAQLVAESIAQQLERRIMFRRAMKRAVAMRCARRSASGQRRRPPQSAGSRVRSGTAKAACRCIPRADVDYGFAEARTTYGDRHQGLIYRARSSISQVGREKQDDSPRGDRRRAASARVARAVIAGEGTNHAATQAEPSTARCTRAATGPGVERQCRFGEYGLKATRPARSRPARSRPAAWIGRHVKRGGKIGSAARQPSEADRVRMARRGWSSTGRADQPAHDLRSRACPRRRRAGVPPGGRQALGPPLRDPRCAGWLRSRNCAGSPLKSCRATADCMGNVSPMQKATEITRRRRVAFVMRSRA